jgi:hypothetical protein
LSRGAVGIEAERALAGVMDDKPATREVCQADDDHGSYRVFELLEALSSEQKPTRSWAS